MVVLYVQFLLDALFKLVKQRVHILDLGISAMRQRRKQAVETLLRTRLVGSGDGLLVFGEA